MIISVEFYKIEIRLDIEEKTLLWKMENWKTQQGTGWRRFIEW